MSQHGTVEVAAASGTLRGVSESGVAVFKGVPYASPPIGALRFKAPRPPAPWTGVRDALAFGPQSIQTSADLALMGKSDVIGLLFDPPETVPNSEDCLYLNVWAPSAGISAAGGAGKRPVMVWCHSGGFFAGSGAAGHCDGTRLAAGSDVVVVTVNHRLGLLGFLHLVDVAGKDYAESGNAGLLDLVAALNWVRENIGAFGGDPGNVTIFGESGGGAKVGALMSMPRARGLFHRAIIQSGSWARFRERADASGVAAEVLARLEIDPKSLASLSEVPVERIAEIQHVTMKALMSRPNSPDGAMAEQHIGPVLDGEVLPYQPWTPPALELSALVPLMIGTTRDEGTFFLSADDALYSLDDAGLQARVQHLLGEKADAVIRAYRKDEPLATPTDLMIEIMTDRIVRMPSIRQAELKAAHRNAPVYMYLFSYETDVLGGRLRSPHGLEIPFAFDNADTDIYAGTRPERFRFARQVSGAWTAFARNGAPSHPELPPWPAYDLQQRATMELDLTSRVVNDPQRHRRLIAKHI